MAPDAGDDFLARLRHVPPAFKPHPFALFLILAVLEEMPGAGARGHRKKRERLVTRKTFLEHSAYTLRVASTGDTREARSAGTKVAPCPSKSSSSTPTPT